MHKSQANRAVIAARLGPGLPLPRPVSRPGTDLRARTSTEVKGSGYVCRKNRLGGRKGQWRDSTGGTSGAWNRSAAGELRRTADSRWDQTVQNQWVGGAR